MQEVELGLAADVGTLQRLPKIVGNERFIVLKFFKLIQLKLDLKSNFFYDHELIILNYN